MSKIKIQVNPKRFKNEWKKEFPFVEKSVDGQSAFCKYCEQTLTLHRSCLESHSKTSKHALAVANSADTKDTNEIMKKLKSKKENNPRKYRSEWKIKFPYAEETADDQSVYCRYCDKILSSHRSSLIAHGKTSKHLLAVAASGDTMGVNCSRSNLNPIRKFEKIEEPDGTLKKILITCAPPMESPISSEDKCFFDKDKEMQKLSDSVVSSFREDLKLFMRKNPSFVKSIKNNSLFRENETGVIRLTRMLVGHLAKDYIMDYSFASLHSGGIPESNVLTSELNSIEKIMKKSLEGVKNMRAQFEQSVDIDHTSIFLDGLDVDLSDG